MSSTTPKAGDLDRREFLVGAAAATLALSPLAASVRSAIAGESRSVTARELVDWSIDDMWSGYPRYAEPIAYARPRTAAVPDLAALADPADSPFVV